MSISVRSVNSGTVAFDSAIRRAMTCWMRVSSWTVMSPFAVPVSVGTAAGAGAGAGAAASGGAARSCAAGASGAGCGGGGLRGGGHGLRGSGLRRGRRRLRSGRLHRGGRRRRGRAVACGRFDVGLHDAPARAGAAHEVQVDALLARHPARQRGRLHAPGLLRRRRLRRDQRRGPAPPRAAAGPAAARRVLSALPALAAQPAPRLARAQPPRPELPATLVLVRRRRSRCRRRAAR